MDIKTASALQRLRLVSAPEAVSYFLLLPIGVVLKNATSFNPVPVLGWVHGILFILYVVFWADAWNRARWDKKPAFVYLVLSVVPLGGFVAERKLRRELDDEIIAARARQEAGAKA
ncbi:DUF3817 domain-containing protein [Actinacidiphila soli]|uniref:DUF3817 domain-containing protein n=1 Tax=Actinacidiphila soli TaxID=2487275 RepID=UPI000FCA1336|nr:DUF3817 domain-containing protein [Actinacidiphila soli]